MYKNSKKQRPQYSKSVISPRAILGRDRCNKSGNKKEIAPKSKRPTKDMKSAHRKFPNRQVLIYMALQILTGLIISVISFNKYSWLLDFFDPIDSRFRAFRTMFKNAPDPIGGKIMLLIWWAGFIPWGIFFVANFSQGFRAVSAFLQNGKWKMLKFFMLGLACTGAVIYAGLFADYGYVSSRTSSVPTRGSIIPFLVDSGAFGGSIFMAASSLVVVFSVALFIAATRGIFILFLRGNNNDL